MNINGASLYNQEVLAMRNSPETSSTLNRLIFIYPFGMDVSLMNIPFNATVRGDVGGDNLGNSLRSFFSITVLKEIFTSNALNMVTMASTYERTRKVKPRSDILIKNLIRGGDGTPYNNWNNYTERDNMREENPMDTAFLQNKINQKFEIIKKALRSDPRMKKLLPFMEVITLQNFFDVPVITGTYPFQLDSTALFTFLSAAIASRARLDSWSNVQKVFTSLHSMPDATVYQIFNVLSNVENRSGSSDPTVFGRNLPGGIASEYEELRNRFNQETNAGKQEYYRNKLNDMRGDYATAYISNLKETKMQELERNFKFMLDPDQLLLRMGINQSNSQASYVTKKINPQTEMMFNRIQEQTVELFGGLNSFFSSIYMIFSPIVSTDPGWNRSFLGMREDMINTFIENFQGFLFGPRGVRQLVSTKLSETTEKSKTLVERINRSCEGAKEDFVSTMNYINRTLSGKQILPSFRYEDISTFADTVDEIIGKIDSIYHVVRNTLGGFFDTDELNQIDSSFNDVLAHTIESYFEQFIRTGNPQNQMQARLFAIFPPNMLDDEKVAVFQQLLSASSAATQKIFKTLFLLIFKLNFCEFVEVADVEFSTASTDILDLPNYCLLLPIEVMQALNVLYTKRNWKDAVIASGSMGFNPANFSYLKGIVRYLKNQLSIPNLIVVDKKKQEIYYSFKHMSSSMEKLKMQSIGTYIKSHIQSHESGISQVYY